MIFKTAYPLVLIPAIQSGSRVNQLAATGRDGTTTGPVLAVYSFFVLLLGISSSCYTVGGGCGCVMTPRLNPMVCGLKTCTYSVEPFSFRMVFHTALL